MLSGDDAKRDGMPRDHKLMPFPLQMPSRQGVYQVGLHNSERYLKIATTPNTQPIKRSAARTIKITKQDRAAEATSSGSLGVSGIDSSSSSSGSGFVKV